MISRRLFVSGTAILAAGLTVARRPASAFTVQVAPKDVEETYHAACGEAIAYHERVVVEARAALDKTALAEPEKAKILKDLACPICHCEIGPS
ncbi:MAG: hypothetical protein QNJ94_01575 [Alphaproteobacteria bacterium]|nr:hypothetical protein [Alphaproteobacteria bacterium]